MTMKTVNGLLPLLQPRPVINGQPPSPLLRNLVSYWKLDEASGVRYDSHGSKHLTDNNTVTQAAGKLGNAAQFTAANSEYLSIADNADLSTGDIDITITAWVYLDSKTATRPIVSKWNGGATSREYLLTYELASDRFGLLVSKDGGPGTQLNADVFGSPSIATWYFIVAWHDSVNNLLGISINNGVADTSSYALGVFDGSAAFQFGKDDGARYMDGRIDEFGFWKRVLTADERAQLYNGGAGLAYPFA